MSGNNKPICVIGSGLSGISAAKALLARNARVLMIDPGLDLEPDTDHAVQQIAGKPAWQWTGQDRSRLRAGVESSTRGVKEKRLFGSDFASSGLDCFPVQKENAAFYMSFARCGLGNIWGAGLLPMHAQDMADWPIAYDDLTPHYENIMDFMPIAARHDSLERLFPLYGRPSFHSLSRQASSMMTRMDSNWDKLEKHGLFHGASRLAGRFHCREYGFECQYCGMCLYGCPYGIVYTGRETLYELQKDHRFTYCPGLVATGFKETENDVKIFVTDPQGNQLEALSVQKALLACGPFATARIVLDSLGIYDKPVYIKTTDQYYLPFFSCSGVSNIESENLHTMCQAFWVLKNSTVSPYMIHSSIYTYNDLYARAIQGLLGRLYSPLKGLTSVFLSHLFFAITYLHSNHSAQLKVTLDKDADKTLNIQGIENPESREIYRKARRLWSRMSKYTGVRPMPFYKGARLPGAGNHNGGTFPMSKDPQNLQTDILGRLPGLEKVHIVDSSVFPSITATTITMSILANAYRIASHAGEID